MQDKNKIVFMLHIKPLILPARPAAAAKAALAEVA
jgi:hypothetical protein